MRTKNFTHFYLITGIFLLAALARFYGLTDWCNNDEHRYIRIIEEISLGKVWPISGPGFVAIVQLIGKTTSNSISHSVAIVGYGASALLLISAWLFYRSIIPESISRTFLVLATTTYFWAELAESRPQLLGCSALLLVAIIYKKTIFSKVNRYTAFWPLILTGLTTGTITAFIHILSFAVISALFTGCVIGILIFTPSKFNKASLLTLAFTSGGICTIFWPTGAYNSMLLDIKQVQIANTGLLLRIGIFAALLTITTYTEYKIHFLSKIDRKTDFRNIFSHYATNITYAKATLTIGILLASAIAIQSYMLPPNYFAVYHNNPSLLLIAQAGNLLFLMLFVTGFFQIFKRATLNTPHTNSILLFILITSMGTISAIMLISSFAMHDTNWMLRSADYFIFIAAPIAAQSRYLKHINGKSAMSFLIISAIAVSFLAGNKNNLFFAQC